MKPLLLVGLMGLVGSLCRYGVDLLMFRIAPVPIPLGTLVINVLGCFFAGLIFVVGVEKGLIAEEVRTGLIVGLAGGFTTFSAYALQTLVLAERGEWMPAVLYWGFSPVAGIGAVWAGFAIARGFLG